MYVQTSGFDNQGSTYFKSPNPEFGATFTYFVKEQLDILKAEFPPVLARLKKAGEDLQKLNKQLDCN